MEPPAFWRDLQLQFKALDPRLELYASECWDGTWSVGSARDGPSEPTLRRSLEVQFRALAERAARGADLAGGTLLDAWLNRLREGPHFVPVEITSYTPPETRSLEGGWIDRLCLASAECCVQLETDAYERGQTRPRTRRSADRVGGPRLAEWLRAQMASRDNMTVHRLHAMSNLDRKTIEKILDGGRVRATALLKLAEGLSSKDAPISASDIPTD